MTTEILEDFANFIAEEEFKPVGFNWWNKNMATRNYKGEVAQLSYTSKELAERYLKTKKNGNR